MTLKMRSSDSSSEIGGKKFSNDRNIEMIKDKLRKKGSEVSEHKSYIFLKCTLH